MFRIKNIRNSTVAKSNGISPEILSANFQNNPMKKPPSRKGALISIKQLPNEIRKPNLIPKKQITANKINHGNKAKPPIINNDGKIHLLKSPATLVSKKNHQTNSVNTLHIHKRQLKKTQNKNTHIIQQKYNIATTQGKNQQIILEKKQIFRQQQIENQEVVQDQYSTVKEQVKQETVTNEKQEQKFYEWVEDNLRKNRQIEQLQKNEEYQKQKQIQNRNKIEEAERRKQERIQRKKREQLEQQQREAEMQIQIKKIEQRRKKRLQQKQRRQQQSKKRQQLQQQLNVYMRENPGPIGEYSLGGMVHLPEQLAHFQMADVIMDAQIKKLIKMNFVNFPNKNVLEAQRDELQRVNTSYMLVREEQNHPLTNGLKNYRIQIFNRIGQLIMEAQNQGFNHQNFQIIEGDSRLPLNFGDGTKILKGLSYQHIQSLTEKINILRQQQCNICLNPLQEGSQARKLKCGHFFHQECIDSWLQSRANCPSCRFNVKYANKS